MTLLLAYQSRAVAHNVTIRDAAGTVITPQAGDVVRIRLTACGTTYLTVTSEAATSGGSTISKGRVNEIRLSETDLGSVEPGNYSYVIDYYDSADGQWKMVEKDVFHLEAA